MLPATPRAGGLPSNPRSSGPGGRQYRRERPNRDASGAPATSARPSRSHGPTTPSPREPPRSRRPSSFDQKSNDSSTSSSSGSSFLDRMKHGTSGYASSITTVEDDYEHDYRKANGQGDVEENGSAQTVGEGYGQTIWSRVATAANSLTVNVGKAWASNIATYAGEETPPGQESRLTRAMKAYHLEKARYPADLPVWLFHEHERRPRGNANAEPRETKESSSPPRGLRDVYDAVSTPAHIHQSNSVDPTIGNRKGTDRLRALREGKRTLGSNVEEGGRPKAIPQARVGLPGGPARNRQV